MTKLLIHSNSPLAPTGYGNQVSTFAPRLQERYELAVSAFYGLEGSPIKWRGIPVLPGLGGEFGNEYLAAHALHFFGESPKNGLVMTLMDVWVLNPAVIQQMNVCSWVPVDHDPAPPKVLDYFRQSGAVPIAMSHFGEERLEEFDPLYVPHGVDTSVYRPYDRKEQRKEFGLPEDAFIVGMVAANQGRPSRKGFQQGLEAFSLLLEKHKDAILYLHTNMNHEWSQGENIPAIIHALQIPDDNLRVVNQYRVKFAPAQPELMAKAYSAFDVLINPAMGEGFGIPQIESQACGTPVIATDFSAMSEVVGAGWKVGWEKFWTGQEAWQVTPHVEELAEAMDEAATMPTEKKIALGVQARQHAMNYDADKVAEEFFLPALAEVEERLALKPKGPSKPAKVVKAQEKHGHKVQQDNDGVSPSAVDPAPQQAPGAF